MKEPLEEAGSPGRIAREEIYDGRIVRLSLDTVRFPGGDTGTLEFIQHRGASAVVPFLDPPDSPDPRIVLVHQYRYAAGGFLYEIPAGMPDDSHETWEACARRELMEETGYRAHDLRYLSRILTTPGFTDEAIHLFAAWELEEGRAERDSDEFIEVVAFRLSEALERIRRGEIVDAKSVVALLFAGQFITTVWPEDRGSPPRV